MFSHNNRNNIFQRNVFKYIHYFRYLYSLQLYIQFIGNWVKDTEFIQQSVLKLFRKQHIFIYDYIKTYLSIKLLESKKKLIIFKYSVIDTILA